MIMTDLKQATFGIGHATPRIDARAKVTGEARYGSDIGMPAAAFAYLVTSTIARGRITGSTIAPRGLCRAWSIC